ncbi:MAG: sulfatase-like hydrolase/transferase [Terriglobia bacterium]
MSIVEKSGLPRQPVTRREFIKGSAVAAALPALGVEAAGRDAGAQAPNKKPPNIIIIIADQFRWDALGAYGLNSMGLTPHLDSMARQGTLFRSHIANQPVCAPSRANLFTGQYQNRHGVWRNGLGLAPDAVTLATTLRAPGYTANYIGKWHLARPMDHLPAPAGSVPAGQRGGFDDLWEGANALERTSHPYEGEMYDAEGKPIPFSGTYRVDFLAQRAVRFLRQASHQPFLLVVSQLEPHFQNDCNCFVGPKGYADRYANPFVPGDLKFFPGDWQKQLPDYYGCCASIDESVGGILGALRELGMEENTIVVFLSDHGCHFRTRNSEYKRSPHESSIHIPLVIQGPGFNRSLSVPELTCQIDITPTLLQAAGLPIPATMQGRSFLPLLDRKLEGWPEEVYVQISESQTGRALRTSQWTYAVVDRQSGRNSAAASDVYEEYQMYHNFDDPHQLLNLAGRQDNPQLVHYQGALSMQDAAAHLRQRLLARMVEAGELRAEIQERFLYP